MPSRRSASFVEALKTDVDYVDISARFRKLIDLTPDEFMALCFGLLSKYTNSTIQSFVADPTSLFVQEGYFQHTAIEASAISKFKKELSATPAELKKVFEKRLAGPSDFTLFRVLRKLSGFNRMRSVAVAISSSVVLASANRGTNVL